MATSSSSVCRVYEMVIHDVIKKLKNDFENEGIDEQVLLDLQYMWQYKLQQSRVLKEFVLPYTRPSSFYDYPLDQKKLNQNYLYSNISNFKIPKESPFYENSLHYTNAYSETSPLSFKPINSYNPQDNPPHAQYTLHPNHREPSPQNTRPHPLTSSASSNVPTDNIGEFDTRVERNFKFEQMDGAFDSEEENEDDLTREESELNSDLDSENGEDPETEDVILCQYDKVSRKGSKWKVTFKDGIMHLGGKDYAFHKATGEFDW